MQHHNHQFLHTITNEIIWRVKVYAPIRPHLETSFWGLKTASEIVPERWNFERTPGFPFNSDETI